MDDGEPLKFSESFSNLLVTLCRAYKISPFDVRREKFYEVLIVIDTMANSTLLKEEKMKEKDMTPAGDDWF